MLGKKIKNLRLKAGLTLEELGKLTNNSRQTLHKYEQGIVTNIPKDKIEKIAEVLNCSPSYLYGWDDEYYYHDEKTRAIAQDIFENEDLRILFDASKDASADDLQLVTSILKNLKERN